MILKQMHYDDKNKIVTYWTEGIASASMTYDEHWQANVLTMRFKGEKDPENLVIHDGDGVYLCNDEGRTVEVLSRLHTPA